MVQLLSNKYPGICTGAYLYGILWYYLIISLGPPRNVLMTLMTGTLRLGLSVEKKQWYKRVWCKMIEIEKCQLNIAFGTESSIFFSKWKLFFLLSIRVEWSMLSAIMQGTRGKERDRLVINCFLRLQHRPFLLIGSVQSPRLDPLLSCTIYIPYITY